MSCAVNVWNRDRQRQQNRGCKTNTLSENWVVSSWCDEMRAALKHIPVLRCCKALRVFAKSECKVRDFLQARFVLWKGQIDAGWSWMLSGQHLEGVCFLIVQPLKEPDAEWICIWDQEDPYGIFLFSSGICVLWIFVQFEFPNVKLLQSHFSPAERADGCTSSACISVYTFFNSMKSFNALVAFLHGVSRPVQSLQRSVLFSSKNSFTDGVVA